MISEITELNEQISNQSNISRFHQKQLEEIRKYIRQINQTENIDTDSFEVYNVMLKKIVVHEYGTIDYYLNCVPFGFRLTYRKERIPESYNEFGIIVESCEVIG